MRKAPASRTTDKATCRMTSPRCGSEERSPVERFTPRRASAGCACDDIHAGAVPKTTPVSKRNEECEPNTGSEGLAWTGMFLRVGKGKSQHHVRPGIGDGQSCGSSDQAEQHALGKDLANEPAACRSEGDAHSNIRAPRGAAREQQIGNVGACNEQNDRGENHEQAQARARLLLQPLNAAAGRRENHVLAGNQCRSAMIGVP